MKHGGKELRPAGNELQRYFQAKREQLLAMTGLPICEHNGLAGSHREELERVYLREVLPKRFEVGRGMVYGQYHRSREADIVVWDSQNYPSLPMLDHAFYFAESVKVVVESKTAYSHTALSDVLSKTRSVRDIVPPNLLDLDDLLEMMLLDIRCLKEGSAHQGLMISKPHIGTAAFFMRGGTLKSVAARARKVAHDLDDAWPDILILLEPGVVVVKSHEEPHGFLHFYDAGADCLFAFTSVFLDLLRDRTVRGEAPHYLFAYAPGFALDPCEAIHFRMSRLMASRVPIRR